MNTFFRCLDSRVDKNDTLYGKFSLNPIASGQGNTFANSLRRSLFSDLSGLAITHFCITSKPGLNYEFTTIPGLTESLLDFSLNLKKIILTGRIIDYELQKNKMSSVLWSLAKTSTSKMRPSKTTSFGKSFLSVSTRGDNKENITGRSPKGNSTSTSATEFFYSLEPKSLPLKPIGFLKVKGPAVLRASDLVLPPGIRCVHPNQYLGTLAADAVLSIKFLISLGKGFIVQDESLYSSLARTQMLPPYFAFSNSPTLVQRKPFVIARSKSRKSCFSGPRFSKTVGSLRNPSVSFAIHASYVSYASYASSMQQQQQQQQQPKFIWNIKDQGPKNTRFQSFQENPIYPIHIGGASGSFTSKISFPSLPKEAKEGKKESLQSYFVSGSNHLGEKQPNTFRVLEGDQVITEQTFESERFRSLSLATYRIEKLRNKPQPILKRQVASRQSHFLKDIKSTQFLQPYKPRLSVKSLAPLPFDPKKSYLFEEKILAKPKYILPFWVTSLMHGNTRHGFSRLPQKNVGVSYRNFLDDRIELIKLQANKKNLNSFSFLLSLALSRAYLKLVVTFSPFLLRVLPKFILDKKRNKQIKNGSNYLGGKESNRQHFFSSVDPSVSFAVHTPKVYVRSKSSIIQNTILDDSSTLKDPCFLPSLCPNKILKLCIFGKGLVSQVVRSNINNKKNFYNLSKNQRNQENLDSNKAVLTGNPNPVFSINNSNKLSKKQLMWSNEKNFYPVLPLDVTFTPVSKVNYQININRDAEKNEETIIFEIWTNASITPKRALQESCLALAQDFYNIFCWVNNFSSLQSWWKRESFESKTTHSSTRLSSSLLSKIPKISQRSLGSLGKAGKKVSPKEYVSKSNTSKKILPIFPMVPLIVKEGELPESKENKFPSVCSKKILESCILGVRFKQQYKLKNYTLKVMQHQVKSSIKMKFSKKQNLKVKQKVHYLHAFWRLNICDLDLSLKTQLLLKNLNINNVYDLHFFILKKSWPLFINAQQQNEIKKIYLNFGLNSPL